jgi:hypothetical protein
MGFERGKRSIWRRDRADEVKSMMELLLGCSASRTTAWREYIKPSSDERARASLGFCPPTETTQAYCAQRPE